MVSFELTTDHATIYPVMTPSNSLREKLFIFAYQI